MMTGIREHDIDLHDVTTDDTGALMDMDWTMEQRSTKVTVTSGAAFETGLGLRLIERRSINTRIHQREKMPTGAGRRLCATKLSGRVL